MSTQHDSDKLPKRPRLLLPPDDLPLSQLLDWSARQLEREQADASDMVISASESESEALVEAAAVDGEVLASLDQESGTTSSAASASTSTSIGNASTTCGSVSVTVPGPHESDDDDDDESKGTSCGFPKVQITPPIPELDAFLRQQELKEMQKTEAEALLTLLVCNR